MSRAAAALVAGLLGIVAIAPPAVADDEPAADVETRARELAASGQRHFDLGEYDEAIADYRAAYKLTPKPGLLYNLAQAFRLDGDCLTATRMYRNYLRLAPESRHRPIVEQHLDALATCAAEREAAGASAAATEGSDPEDVPPPPPPKEEEIVATPPPDPEPPPAPPPRGSGRKRKVIGLAVAATGAVAAAAGGYFAFDAMRAGDEVSRGYAEGAAWSELDAIDARGRRSEVIGISLIAAGGVAVVCGATLYVLGRHADRRTASAAVVPSTRGATIEVTWRF
jgi:tetratricopeptide (TPR) repeat protein